MTVKILWFHLRNSKGVVDIEWEPKQSGTTTIGGKSGQGKTAALNNIAWLLGGDRYKPDKAQRVGSSEYPDLDIKLSNGLRVTRKGKRSTLKVIDEDKKLGNQSMLREFVGSFALDVPKFLRLNGKEKAEALLNIIGVGDELRTLDKQHDDLYSEREAHGRVTTQKEKYAAELEFHKDMPEEETSLGEIVAKIQAVDKANTENADQRRTLESMTDAIGEEAADIEYTETSFTDIAAGELRKIAHLEKQLASTRDSLSALQADHKVIMASKHERIKEHQQERAVKLVIVDKLIDQPTDALQEQLDKCEETNVKVRANAEKKVATTEGGRLRGEYAQLTEKIENTRAARIALLDNADLPLPGLGILMGELTYEDMPWDSMATSDQMKVAAAISSKENPNCGFVLLDGLETMDVDTLSDFNAWGEGEDLQVIGTRVSTGDECTLIIRDGEVVQAEETDA